MGRIAPPKTDPTPAPPSPAPPSPKGGVGIVTADTPTRDIGDVSVAAFRAFAKGSPLESVAAACVAAATGWGAMALTFAKKESSLGTGESATATRNPLGLMRRAGDARACTQLPGGCLLRFPTWADAFREFAVRMAAPPYDPAKSLKHNVLVYVGGPRCPDILAADQNGVCANGHRWDTGNPDTDLRVYVEQTVARINAVKALDAPAPSPKPVPVPVPPKPAPTGPVFGRVPRPPIRDQVIDKPAGWADYGPRDLLLAIVLHTVIGNASTTGQYFARYDPTKPNGGHGWNALTDWGVCNANDGPSWDGVILKWNDPDGRRSPFASGGYGPPHGDGPAYVALCARLGYNINRASEAIEVSRLTNTAYVSPACLRSVIALAAYRVDRKAKVPWNVWPKNTHGIQMILTHAEMGKPGCNAVDIVTDVIDGVRDALKEYQGQGAPVPPPPVVDPKTRRWLDEMDLPDGVDEAFLRRRFGRFVAPDGRVFAFDAGGIVSEAWASVAVETGRYPAIETVEFEDGNAIFVFDGGLAIDARAGAARPMIEDGEETTE